MTDLRETMARAIFETYAGSEAAQHWSKDVSWDQLQSWPGLLGDGDKKRATSLYVQMIRDEASAVLSAIEAAGYVVVPRQPTVEMLAATAPIATATPSSASMAMAAATVEHMRGRMTKDALMGIGQIAEDYRAMIAAAPPLTPEAGKE